MGRAEAPAVFTCDVFMAFVIVFRWSNVNRPGQWLFQVGPIDEGENIKTPDNIEGDEYIIIIHIIKYVVKIYKNMLM